MYELFILYIGSPWFLGNEHGPIKIMAPITCIAMLYMVILTLSMNSLKKSNHYSFLYSFIGCNFLGFIFYGYVAVPLCLLWVRHVKQITMERIKYYYIRHSYGHLGGWHDTSDLDALLDYDKLIDEVAFDKEKMKDFYSSDRPIWAGFITAIFVIFISSIMFDGYIFLPRAVLF